LSASPTAGVLWFDSLGTGTQGTVLGTVGAIVALFVRKTEGKHEKATVSLTVAFLR
jgi:hypothetical protein